MNVVSEFHFQVNMKVKVYYFNKMWISVTLIVEIIFAVAWDRDSFVDANLVYVFFDKYYDPAVCAL